MTSTAESSALHRITQPLLLAALILPLLPAVAPLAIAVAATLLGCSSAGEGCSAPGVDITALYAGSTKLLRTTAGASTGGMLLVYLMFVTALAQTTIHDFRGRVVRTFATVLGVGVMPFVLSAASAHAATDLGCSAQPAQSIAACPPTGILEGISFYGTAFFGWLADIAVPLAVLATLLLVLSLGYRQLAARLALAISGRS